MTRRYIWISVLISMLAVIQTCSSTEGDFPIAPTARQGKPWRLGYLEGGTYVTYPSSLKALVHGLAELGWLRPLSFPEHLDGADTRPLWQWLVVNVKSQYIEFVADAYWSNKWDNKDLRPQSKAEILMRLNQHKDIDLMIAMGTWAGQDLAINTHSTPTVIMAARDPLQTGIIKSAEDSGYDHVFAHVDPKQYERQVRFFHKTFKFKRLGIVYDQESMIGRQVAAIDSVEKVAREQGFAILACNAPAFNTSKFQAKQNALQCYERLAPQVDAVYISHHRGVTLRKLPKILAPLLEYGIPTFSQSGIQEVKHGVLMGFDNEDYQNIGLFYARAIAMILNGAKPRSLNQAHESPLRITLNLQTARLIGYEPPQQLLAQVDKSFKEIQSYLPADE